MKNVAYAVLLITSFALGCFGAFMVYHGIGMPPHGDAAMSEASFVGMASLAAGAVGIVYTCAHALAYAK
jgi:hypothetical protein